MTHVNSVILIENPKTKQKFKVGANEKKTFVIFLTGKKDLDSKVSVSLTGKNSKAYLLGLVIGEAESKFNLSTLQDHQKPRGVSDLLVKAALFGKSRFYYQGLIKVEKDAQKTNAYQKNQNLLLSPDTWADSRPKLEILANDVRCTHGATIGQVDPQVLYYLKTRGLPEKKAVELVLSGFFREVLDRIPDQKIKNKLEKRLFRKIANLI